MDADEKPGLINAAKLFYIFPPVALFEFLRSKRRLKLFFLSKLIGGKVIKSNQAVLLSLR